MQSEELFPIQDSLDGVADQLRNLNATLKSIDKSLDSIRREMGDFDSIRRGLVGIEHNLENMRV